jgi:hypothetical protein
LASQATRSGPSIAGSGLQQVGHPPGRDDGDPVSLEHAPGDGCAVDGDHHGDLDVGDAKDLVRLVGRPQHLAGSRRAGGGHARPSRRRPAAAAPDTAAVDHQHPAGADRGGGSGAQRRMGSNRTWLFLICRKGMRGILNSEESN